jgi:hypothetical protein
VSHLRALGRSLNPPEIGGWFMIGFPLLAGLASRPSRAGAALALCGFTAFLMRVPLKQLRTGVRVAMSKALLVAGGVIILGAATAAALQGPGAAFLPLAVALPAAAFALHADLRKQARNLGAELAALAFFCAFAAAIPLAGGAPLRDSAGLWAQVFLSLAPGFAVVRYQLYARRSPQGEELKERRLTMRLALALSLLAGAALAAAGLAGPAWWALQVLLCGRGLVPLHRGPAWNLGVLEILADAASTALVVLKL